MSGFSTAATFFVGWFAVHFNEVSWVIVIDVIAVAPMVRNFAVETDDRFGRRRRRLGESCH